MRDFVSTKLLKLVMSSVKDLRTNFEDDDEVLFGESKPTMRRARGQLNLCVALVALFQLRLGSCLCQALRSKLMSSCRVKWLFLPISNDLQM
jgi:hypothetical protein